MHAAHLALLFYACPLDKFDMVSSKGKWVFCSHSMPQYATSLRVRYAWLRAAPNLIQTNLLAYSGQSHVAAIAKYSHTSMVKYRHKSDFSLPCLCCRYVTVPVFDDASYDQIEAEVLQFFNMTEIVTPDEVRGNYSTLSDAVLANSRYASSASHCCRIGKRSIHLSASIL